MVGWILLECKRCDNVRRERGRQDRGLPSFGDARKMKRMDELGVERETGSAPWVRHQWGASPAYRVFLQSVDSNPVIAHGTTRGER